MHTQPAKTHHAPRRGQPLARLPVRHTLKKATPGVGGTPAIGWAGEHPAVTLKILGPVVPLTDPGLLSSGERKATPDACACLKCASMSSTYTSTPSTTYGVVDQARVKIAGLGVVAGALVLGTGRAEHDHAVAELHVHLGDMSVCVGPTPGLAEAEGLGDPIGGAGNVLVGDHRDNGGMVRRASAMAAPFGVANHPKPPVCHPGSGLLRRCVRLRSPTPRRRVKLCTPGA